ncbi:hypothetical protein KSC_037150 [Ktedonobacter sp. SOSP1-52]|uniref:serine/threonine-protein kinase n=1 Tax=Ktedonobacter sp. SOSP1-52 TaxID=2778366 RepID=UPI001914E933|nr:serine/threonine-protein kinase [Ktedonobacter sp. SOSP1-52]GHO64823.1 hypothetical protein KSC_037150 [Ktedonobacter sp. SOSP1-52]
MALNQATEWQGKMLDRYRMLHRLGHGGMGQVWQAEDTELHRMVAIKILPSILASEQSFLHAFAYEARAAATLEHPHILTIHAFGEQPISDDEIVTYIVMPYLQGGTLRDVMKRERYLTRDLAMNYLRQVAEAIDYAHSQQVIHRDIKPANMLLQNDWLYLADFGIAKLLTSTTYRSKTYAGSGTPEYMAPEQVQGSAIPASDRYSLAVIAYQLFTGNVPFHGATPYDLMIKQLMEEPRPPREINPILPQGVEAIILQGLAKRPEERPPSCLAFVDALDNAWSQSPIARTNPNDPEATLLAPWSKKRPEYLPTHVTPPVAPRTLEAPVNGPQTSQGTTAPPPPPSPTHMAAYPTTPQTLSQYMPTPSATPMAPEKPGVSRRSILIGGAATAALLLGGGAAWAFWPRPQPKLQAVEPGPRKFISGAPTLSLMGHKRPLSFILWSPDGARVATASTDHSIMIWDTNAYLQQQHKALNIVKTPLQRWRLEDVISYYQISWSYNGQRLLALTQSASTRNTVYAFDLTTNAQDPLVYQDSHIPKSEIGAPSYYEVVASPTSSLFVTDQLSGQSLQLWDLKDMNQPVKTLNNSSKGSDDNTSILTLAWAPDGKHFAAYNSKQQIHIFDSKGNSTQTIELADRASQVAPNAKSILLERFALAWCPNNPNLIAVSNLDVIDVWDIQKKKQLHRLETDDPDAHDRKGLDPTIAWYPQVYGMTWSPNGRYIAASYSHSQLVHIWDLANRAPKKSPYGNELQTLMFGNPGHSGSIMDLAWQPGAGRYLATASADNTAIIWRMDA